MTHTDESIMRIISERLEKHGFTESNKKPGLFFQKTNMATYYVDCRRSRTQYYGFLNDGDMKVEQSEIDERMKEVRLELASVGITDLTQFEEKADEGLTLEKEYACANCGNSSANTWNSNRLRCGECGHDTFKVTLKTKET